MAITITEHVSGIADTFLYDLNIDGNTTIQTTVTSDPNQADEWVSRTVSYYSQHYEKNRFIVGIADQLSPLDRTQAATLQLCVGRNCLIFQFTRCTAKAKQLIRLLLEYSVTFVCLDHQTNLRLAQTSHRFHMRVNMPIDLRSKVPGWDMEGWSVPRIAREYLEIGAEDLDMEEQMSDWNAAEFDAGQVIHASLAAVVPFLVGVKSNAWTLNPNRNIDGNFSKALVSRGSS